MQSVLAWIDARALHLMLGLYFLVGLAFVFLGDLNFDEGWYLYASRLVYEGEIPYKDFPYFQMPLMPYVFGLPQIIFGPGILVGRLTCFALSLITVGVGVHLAQRIAGRGAALLFLAFTMLNVHVMWTYTNTRTEPLVIPLVMLSLLVLLKQPRGTMDLVLAPSLMLWAVAVRLTVALAFLSVLAFCLYQARRNPRQRDAILVAVGLQVVTLIVVPLVLAGERMVFDVWSSQEFRTVQLGGASPPMGALLRDRALVLTTFVDYYPLVAILTLGMGFFLALLWRNGWRPSLSQLNKYPAANLVMLALAVLIFLPHVFLNPIHHTYFVAPFAILALMTATAVAKLARPFSPQPGKLAISSLLVGLLLISGLQSARDFPVEWSGIDTARPDWPQLRQVASYLRSVVPPDKQVLTFEANTAVEADRRVAHGLEMGLFSLWPGFKTGDARHYGVVNYEILQEIVRDDATSAIVLYSWDLPMLAIGNPYLEETASDGPEQSLFRVLPAAKGRYRLVKEYYSFGQRRDTLLIYLRTD